MSLTGILRTWHDDRGFGFIAPTHGGREIFVHISAFPRDGSRPTEGEQLIYELGRGKNGEAQAIKAVRTAIGQRPPVRTKRQTVGARNSKLPLLIGIALILGVAAGVYARFGPPDGAAPAPVGEPPTHAAPATALPASPFRCDERRHCSQMTSCAEATYFLRNCPGVEMDGDRDGTPCETQWCTSPFAK